MSLTDLLGNDHADWMGDPNRRCAIPAEVDRPGDIRLWADSWHPSDGREDRAKRLCRGCPTSVQCAQYAIERPELDGVWGGTTTAERAEMRRNTDVA